MEIDKKVLNDALSASPEQLSALARGIAQALGVSEDKALALARNPEIIKSRLAGMSEQDLRSAAAMLGPEKAAQIMSLLKGGNG